MIESLTAKGLLIRPRSRGPVWLHAAAIALVAFAAGILGSELSRGLLSPPPEPRYALLLYGGSEPAAGPEHAARVEEYGRWASGLKEGARFVSGHELGATIADIGAPGAQTESAGAVGGFFLIDASSDATATRIARGCPHLKYGGRVIIRKIEA